MNDENDLQERTPGGLTRRQLAKGAAWSVPILAVSTATPLAAASTNPTFDLAATISAPVYVPGAGSTWTYNFCNVGTSSVPALTPITVTFTGSPISGTASATVNISMGIGASTYTTYSPVLTQTVAGNAAHSQSFTIVITSPLPPGACFSYVANISWGFNFNGSRIVSTATAGLSDANNANNSVSTPAL